MIILLVNLWELKDFFDNLVPLGEPSTPLSNALEDLL